MIDHTGVVATNYEKSKQFYTRALAPLGYQLMMELPKEVTGGRGVAGFGVPPVALAQRSMLSNANASSEQ